MTKLLQIDGLPIIDAKRPMRLSITKPDIAKAAGSTQEPSRCAAARACLRELHVKEARIHIGRIYLRTNDHNWVRYQTPPRLRSEIVAFDRGGVFEPCDVILKPPPHQSGQRQGGEDQPRPRPSSKPRRGYHRIENVRGGPA